MFPEPAVIAVFLPAALALNITPGSDFLYCLGQGAQGGRSCGIAASLGITTGSLIHCALAAAGLAAMLSLYPVAFEIIRWAGVAYLLWLGLRSLIEQPAVIRSVDGAAAGAFDNYHTTGQRQVYRAWRDGVVVNLLNPKVAIFILAFIPQFVDPSRGRPVLQFLFFCLLFNITGTTINALVGVFGARIGAFLRQSPSLSRFLQVLSAIIFLILALRLALG